MAFRRFRRSKRPALRVITGGAGAEGGGTPPPVGLRAISGGGHAVDAPDAETSQPRHPCETPLRLLPAPDTV